MKDYYDIYYPANKFDFDGVTLTQALKTADVPLQLGSLSRLWVLG